MTDEEIRLLAIEAGFWGMYRPWWQDTIKQLREFLALAEEYKGNPGMFEQLDKGDHIVDANKKDHIPDAEKKEEEKQG